MGRTRSPVLLAVADIYEETGNYLTRARDVERKTGLDEDAVQRALRKLNTTPSFFEKVTDSSGGIIAVGPPTGEALRFAGAWCSPEQLLERLIRALETAAADGSRGPPGKVRPSRATQVGERQLELAHLEHLCAYFLGARASDLASLVSVPLQRFDAVVVRRGHGTTGRSVDH